MGAADAEALVPEFMPTFTEEDIVNLPKYEIYLKLMIDGIASEPFSAKGLPPLTDDEKTGNLEKIIKISRERYASERSVVEDKIMRWHLNDGIDSDLPISKKDVSHNNLIKNRNFVNKTDKKIENKKTLEQEEVYKYKVNCARCSKETQVSFKPDGIRPVYCKDCLKIIREEKKNEIELRKNAKKDELQKIESNLEEKVKKLEPISLKDAFKNQAVGFNKKNKKHKEENYSPSPPIFKKEAKKDQDQTAVKPNILDINSGGTIKF